MNLRVRIKNPVFWSSILLSVLMPILTYFGLSLEDLTSWSGLFGVLKDAVMNPFVVMTVVSSIYGTLIDPTTKGVGDSALAKTYTSPK